MKKFLPHVVGIDLGNASIKVIEAKGEQALNLWFQNIDPFASREEREILWRDFLRELFATRKIKTKWVILIHSSPKIYVRKVTYPKMPREDLWMVMERDAKAHLPPSVTRCLFDYYLLGGDEEHMEMVVVYVEEEEVRRKISLIEEQGGMVISVIPAPFTLGSGLEKETRERVRAILDIGAAVSTLSIFKDGNFRLSTQIGIAGNDFTRIIAQNFNTTFSQAEELKIKEDFLSPKSRVYPLLKNLVQQLAEEIKIALQFYSQQYRGESVEEISFVGGGSRWKSLKEMLEEELGLPISSPNPLRKLNTNLLTWERRDYLGRKKVEFAPLIGGLLYHKDLPNLLSREVEERKEKERKRIFNLSFASILLSLSVISLTPFIARGLIWKAETNIEKKRLEQLIPLVERVNQVEMEKAELEKKLEFIGRLKERKNYPWKGLLQSIGETIPEEVWINRMVFNSKEDKVTVMGSTMKEELVTQWMVDLKNTEFLRNVRMVSLRRRKGGEMADFTLECELGK